jgi:Ca2+/Na+ antiporter
VKKILHKRKVLKKWVRITIFILLCAICLFAIYLISYGILKKEKQKNFEYSITNKADYKIYLNNSEDEIVEMNKPAISNDIDYIDVRYNYNFLGNDDSKVKYLYKIIATLVIEYENSTYGKQILYSKDYNLSEEKEGQFESTSSFGLSDNVKVNYKEYSEIVKKYKNEKNVNVTAHLDLKMIIENDGTLKTNDTYKINDEITLKIPLTEKVVMITQDYKDTEKNIVEQKKEKENIQLIPVIIGFVTLLTSLTLLIHLSKTVIFINTKSRYKKEIEKLFKEYSEILVEVSSPIEFDNFTFIDIKEFDDMIDLEEEYKSPILYYEKVKDYESWFVVIKDNFMYRYIYKAE